MGAGYGRACGKTRPDPGLRVISRRELLSGGRGRATGNDYYGTHGQSLCNAFHVTSPFQVLA